jgi:hypothetical protein
MMMSASMRRSFLKSRTIYTARQLVKYANLDIKLQYFISIRLMRFWSLQRMIVLFDNNVHVLSAYKIVVMCCTS